MEFQQKREDKRRRINEVQRPKVPSSLKAWMSQPTVSIEDAGKGVH